MRSRNIKPGFFKNDILASVTPLGRLLFQGLWLMSDSSGRLENRSVRIKAEILPYDKCNIDKLLKDLHQKGFIILYEYQSEKYIQIVNFKKHQHTHIKEPESTIPAPDKNQTSPVQEPDKYGAKTSDSLLLNTESLLLKDEIPIPGFPHFKQVWDLYPNKDGKAKAESAFKRTVKTQEDFNLIQKALKNYLNSERVKKGYIKNGSTWFNGWKDWIEYTEENKNGNKSGNSANKGEPGKFDGVYK